MLKNQESWIINGGQTNYLKLERGTRQGDSLSEYPFILVLEIAFIKIKRNPNINSLNICNNDFLYTAYSDDTTFFYNMTNLQQKSRIILTLSLNFLVLKVTNQNVK